MAESNIDSETVESLLHHLLEPFAHSYPDGVTLADAAAESGITAADIKSVRTYEDACLMTSDRGVVLYLKDGSEYQITVVQRR